MIEHFRQGKVFNGSDAPGGHQVLVSKEGRHFLACCRNMCNLTGKANSVLLQPLRTAGPRRTRGTSLPRCQPALQLSTHGPRLLKVWGFWKRSAGLQDSRSLPLLVQTQWAFLMSAPHPRCVQCALAQLSNTWHSPEVSPNVWHKARYT